VAKGSHSTVWTPANSPLTARLAGNCQSKDEDTWAEKGCVKERSPRKGLQQKTNNKQNRLFRKKRAGEVGLELLS
jgi:hypothetical protein